MFIFVSFEVYVKYVQVHPDMNRADPDSTNKFLRLRDAYTVLSSTELRREYDLQLRQSRVLVRPQTYESDFTETYAPPRQSYYRFGDSYHVSTIMGH